MQLLKHLFSIGLVGSLVAGVVQAQEERSYTLQERELEYIMDILPGTFDNQEQVAFNATASGETAEGAVRGMRVNTTLLRLDAPKIGGNVFYAETKVFGKPDDVVRQRVYVLSADEEAKAIRTQAYAFKKAAAYLGAARDPSRFSNLKGRALTYLDGCDFLVRRDATWFAGEVDAATCSDPQNRISMRLSADELWLKGDALGADTSWRQMQRARWFACMVDFPRTPGGRPVVTHHYIKLHDQGGAFDFTHPDGRDMALVMRNTWSYGMKRETFFIGVLDGDVSGPTLVYAWGEPGADRIGVNPGYLRVQCDLDSEENVKLQKGLRSDS